jgi:GT2 family glycosyltransferase/glycosyltransferase involved in cell wall biosynthesis
MRVLVVAHGFPPAAQGGSEIYAHDHARAMQRLGDTVAVLTREQDRSRPEYALRHEARDGLQVAWVNNTFRQTIRFDETYRNPAIGAVADRVIDEYAPEIAYVHHLTCLSTSIITSLAARGVPIVFILHDYWLMCHRGQLLDTDCNPCDGPADTACRRCIGPTLDAGRMPGARSARFLANQLPVEWQRRIRRTADVLSQVLPRDPDAPDEAQLRLDHMRAIASQVTLFVAPSRSLRERFIAFGIPPERIAFSGYGFEHGPFRRCSRSDMPRLRIGFLGSLMVSKAPHVLLEAFSRLPAGTASVDLYGAYTPYHGDDTYRSVLQPLLQLPGVTVHGPVAHEQVPRALADIDVLVVPSVWRENSPLVIQEAFLAGVPVVASRIGGIPEVVDDGRGGALFSPGDVEELSRILARLTTDREYLEALRASIPVVRTIEDDVQGVRALVSMHASRFLNTAAVILNYRTHDETILAVRALAASDAPLSDIIVVDNDEAADVDLAAALGPGVTVLHTGANLGFSGGVNRGIREGLARGADRILLVNSDVIVPPDCLARLERALAVSPCAGIAGPVVRSRSHPDVIASRGMTYVAAIGRMRHRDSGERVVADSEPAVSPADAVAGCAMLVTRETLDAVGLFDEDYFYAFEDLDFCLRAARAGFRTVVANAAVVYHEGGRSIGAASTARLYFAARNHLRLAGSTGRPGTVASIARSLSIVALNVAHALRTGDGGTRLARLRAVARGVRDYRAGRFGAGSEAGRLAKIAQLG